MRVPVDSLPISNLIDEARDPNSEEIRRFGELYLESDNLVMDAYGLSVREKDYVTKRLTHHPFDVLQPRWPWTSVAMREIQVYTEDRFA